MAEDFRAGIIGWNWWDSTKTVFLAAANSSPCSMEFYDIRTNGAHTGFVDMKVSPCKERVLNSDSATGDGTFLIDSALPTMGFGLSSSSTTSDWNHTLLQGDDDDDTTLDSITGTKLNYDHQETSGLFGGEENRSIFKPNDLVFLTDDQPFPSSTKTYDNITTTCQGLSMAFPVGTISNGFDSILSQSLFQSQPQSTQFQPSGFHFFPSSTTNPIWNASAVAPHEFESAIFPSSQSQSPSVSTLEECPNLTANMISCEAVRESISIVEKENDGNDETVLKKPRSEVLSPLPTLKVRKEKLSNKIIALQQLVSPFGKTDTASVLYEAIEYIKFLHDQVNVLSTPYMKIEDLDLQEKNENGKQDLRARGLCLVSITSTNRLAEENALEFWSPTFGGTFSVRI